MLAGGVLLNPDLLQLSSGFVCLADLLRCILAEPLLERYVVLLLVLSGEVVIVLRPC